MIGQAGSYRRSTIGSWHLALCIVFLAALAPRLYGLDWDDGADLHPDELFIAKIVLIDRIHFAWPPDLERLLDPARSGLNPRSADPATGQFREFAYGALPLWVTDAVASILSRLTGTDWNGIDHAYLVGRFMSALLSALTILPIAALGRAAGGVAAGLLAALFAALAPMSIQLAHFFTTDSWLTFFVACCLLACLQAARQGRWTSFALAGISMGLAMASKGSVFALAVPILAAVAIAAIGRRTEQPPAEALRRAARNLLVAGGAAAAAFFAFEPYALLQPNVYMQSLRTQADIVSGRFDVPFTRVYAGTTPLIYQLEQLVRWGYGPVAGILALLGLAVLAVAAIRRGSVVALILLSWAVPYGAVLLVADVKFLRYLEPISPVLAVGAAVALIWLSEALKRRRWAGLSRAVAPVAVLLAVAWTGAFVSIYAHENPRLAATKWIYATVPPGANLTAEYWDDALPRSLSYAFSPAAYGYGTIMLDFYRDLPPAEASDAVYHAIEDADYIVQSSQRVEAAMHAAPWRYPVQGRFFDLLARERLGFTSVATFERRPAVGGLTIDDSGADESFINYDHPRVTIYERTETISRSAFDRLMSWALQRPWYPSRAPAEPTLLLDRPVGENPSVNDARWSAPLTGSPAIAAAFWLVLVLALTAVGLPLARLALQSFPDAGWGLARTIGLIVAAYPIWLGASLQLFRFRAAWVLTSLIVVALVGRLVMNRLTTPESDDERATRRRAWLHAEAAFWLVFAIFLSFRLVVPDGWHPLWGGEKPMEFSLINAIGRSAFFPPYDPWFADGYVNYYYYGFYLVSFMFKATGIPAEIAFNLALPTVMGMLASGGFSVGGALARGLTRSRRMAIGGGWLAVVTICLIGNLTSLRGLLGGAPPGFDPFIAWVWNGSRAIENAITEFPFFTGLYADLHAHVVALPLTLLAIALSLELALSRHLRLEETRSGARGPGPAMVVRLLLLALTLGALAATNAWDVPVYASLAITSLLMGTSSIRPVSRRSLAAFIGGAVVIAGGAWLLYLPFHRHYVPLFSQLALVRDPTDLLQFLSHLGGLVAICSFGLTSLLLRGRRGGPSLPAWPALAILLALLGLLGVATVERGPLAVIAILALCGAIGGPPLVASWLCAGAVPNRPPIGAQLGRVASILFALAGIACVLSGRPVLGLTLALGGAAAVGWLAKRRVADRFVCLLLAAAFFTAAGAEVVVVADDLIGTTAYRMNTIFKFYNQVWILLAVAASALAASMARDSLVGRRTPLGTRRQLPTPFAWSKMGLGLTAVTLAASLTYPLMAIGPRLAQRFEPGTRPGTLNALGWMQQGTVPVFGSAEASQIGFRGDAAAIAWLLENVDGTPVIAEASIGPYRCNGTRITAATGLPTIIGWERHQQQQRYPETLSGRVADVRTLFTSPDIDEKLDILARYNVEYVVVGDLERIYPIANNECTPAGSQAGIEAFDQMVGTSLEVAHAEAGTTIYRVLPSGVTG